MRPFLIVGQGLAGTTLAFHLLKNGASIEIINNPELPSSSKVAGGMFNPVTGKHLAKTWLVDTLYPYLHSFYSDIEDLTNDRFLFSIPIYRPFKNEQQKNQFTKAIEKHDLKDYCQVVEEQTTLSKGIDNSLGGILTKHSGRLDVKNFLKASEVHFGKMGILKEGQFEPDQIIHNTSSVAYKAKEYEKIIFCEGAMAQHNKYFNWLPFNPVKGETFDFKMEQDIDWIINQGKWFMPLGNGQYKAGSTYVWHELDQIVTEKGKEIITEGLQQFLKTPIQITGQEAGVRPATKDRRPFSGPHPEFRNLYIFNGLGTKGVSLAPFLAKNLAEHLILGKEIDQETTIARHYALY